jgi:hypothetical protein
MSMRSQNSIIKISRFTNIVNGKDKGLIEITKKIQELEARGYECVSPVKKVNMWFRHDFKNMQSMKWVVNMRKKKEANG